MPKAGAPDPASAPVRPATGLPYLRFLRLMHKHLKPEWYLEIGTETGKSLKRAIGKTIAVDPEFRIKHDILGELPELHLFRQTSDDFFASGVAGRLAQQIDFAFLDGLHLIEQLLRDFIETERLSGPESVIAVHDIVPLSWIGAARDWDRTKTASWTGDVWKLVPILRRYRPDLEVRVADCAPSGLLLVTELDPKSTDLSDHYEEIVASFVPLTLEEYGAERLVSDLGMISARAPDMAHFVGADSVRAPESPEVVRPGRIALRIQAVNAQKAPLWGEYHLARGLQRAFEDMGRAAVIQPRSHWSDRDPGQIDIALWGLRQDLPPVERHTPLLAWLLYNPDAAEDGLLEAARHVFVASEAKAQELGGRLGPEKVSPLLQAFDAEVMRPDGHSVPHAALFAGNGRKRAVRRTVRLALDQKVPIELYGERWEGTAAEPFLKGRYIPNEALPAHYRGAAVVLNDHKFGMGVEGFVSNRIFDALACGAPLVSDRVTGLPDDIAPLVHIYDEDAGFEAAVKTALAEDAGRRQARRDAALGMRDKHSLAQRAKRILEYLD